MCETEYAEGGAKLHHPAQDRVKQTNKISFSSYTLPHYVALPINCAIMDTIQPYL